MPVAIGNELKLQDNKVSAEYGELFIKLLCIDKACLSVHIFKTAEHRRKPKVFLYCYINIF